jgi:hypothetical protein
MATFIIVSKAKAGIKKSKRTNGNSYFVSAVTGNDNNDGSLAHPFKTIQKAANTVVAGDTVNIKAGIYNERVLITTTGTLSTPIDFNAIETGVVIDGTGISWNPPGTPNPFNGLMDLFGVSHISLNGLKIINSTYAGFFMENCSHISISGCQSDNTVSSGIGVWGSDAILIENNTVQRACNGGGEESITLAVTTNSEVRNNEVFNNIGGVLGGEGIDVKQGSHHVLFHHNHIHHMNSRVGLYVDAYDAHTHTIEVYNNLVHDCSESGIAIASEGGGLLENIKIYNNISYNNLYGGIEVGGWTTVAGTTQTPIHFVKITNNTCYNNSEGINIDNAFAENIDLRNNICSQNTGLQLNIGATPMAQVLIDYNLSDGVNTINGNHALLTSPHFTDAINHDFHLLNTSPAINTGTTLDAPSFDNADNPRNDGNPDLGAFEHQTLLFKNGFES